MRGAALVAVLLVLLGRPSGADAQNTPDIGSSNCVFRFSGSVMRLEQSCTTERSISIPNGMILDGNRQVITAVDPPGGRFRGGIVVARGGWASVINITVTAELLADVCLKGEERLRGIYFQGASGIIRGNRVQGVNKAGSACEEGNGIEVRNDVRDSPFTTVEIDANRLYRYQKSGIVAHGNVDVYIHANELGPSSAQERLAANAIQIGPTARGTVLDNVISANTYPGSDAAGTGVLLVETAPGTRVSGNAILGSGDVGIHVLADEAIVEENDISDVGPDGPYDVGIVNLGVRNLIRNNVIQGYQLRYYGIEHAEREGREQRIEE
jgi:hypothetical protein